MTPIEDFGLLIPFEGGEPVRPLGFSFVVVLPRLGRYLDSVRKFIGMGIVRGRVHFFTMNFLPLEFDRSLLFLFCWFMFKFS